MIGTQSELSALRQLVRVAQTIEEDSDDGIQTVVDEALEDNHHMDAPSVDALPHVSFSTEREEIEVDEFVCAVVARMFEVKHEDVSNVVVDYPNIVYDKDETAYGGRDTMGYKNRREKSVVEILEHWYDHDRELYDRVIDKVL